MNTIRQLAVSSTPYCPELRAKAEYLAIELTLPYCSKPPINTLFLLYDHEGLSLCQKTGKKEKLQKIIFVDFIQGKHGYRLAHNCTIKQTLARAVGIKSGVRPHIIDATAGLGGDSFVFASLGCQVTMIERNPVIATLLNDGLSRAKILKRYETIVARMELVYGNSNDFLKNINCDTTIYLDPMYPSTDSHAEKKIAMRVLRTIVGDDNDAEQTFIHAEKGKPKRIVVKRPRMAPTISNRKPDVAMTLKSCRYDIYFAEK